MTVLTPFDERDVTKATIAVTNAGDGLSKSLEIQPQEWHHGDTVHVVLRCQVSKVTFVEDADSADLTRVHTLTAGTSTIVDGKLVAKVLAAQEKAIEAAKGVLQLGDEEDGG
jgi:hypothetical protein